VLSLALLYPVQGSKRDPDGGGTVCPGRGCRILAVLCWGNEPGVVSAYQFSHGNRHPGRHLL